MMKLLKKIIKYILITNVIIFAALYVIGMNTTDVPYSADTELTITGGPLDIIMPIDEDAIEDSKYYDSVQEASKARKSGSDAEQGYMCNIDEVIFQAESENYITIYYRSVKNEKTEGFTIAKFKKKKFDGKTKYAFLTCSFSEAKKGAWIFGNFEEHLRQVLILLDYDRDMSVYPGEKRFIRGDTNSEKIFNLKIEGQEPTEIIPYECFGEQWYFWYYEDLQSDKPGNMLEFTVE